MLNYTIRANDLADPFRIATIKENNMQEDRTRMRENFLL
jgi:hypothetical protein